MVTEIPPPGTLSLMEAQAAVAERPELEGNVAFVETKDFCLPSDVSPSRQAHHRNSSAETCFPIGGGMGRAMIDLVR